MLTREQKHLAGFACGLLLMSGGAFILGRSTVKTQVRTETKIVTVTKEVQVEKRVEGPVRIVDRVIETPGPAGPVIERVRIEERAPITVEKTGGKEFFTNTVVETITNRPDWSLSLKTGWSRLQPEPDVYGLLLERRVLGSMRLGVWTNRTSADWAGGVSVGFSW